MRRYVSAAAKPSILLYCLRTEKDAPTWLHKLKTLCICRDEGPVEEREHRVAIPPATLESCTGVYVLVSPGELVGSASHV